MDDGSCGSGSVSQPTSVVWEKSCNTARSLPPRTGPVRGRAPNRASRVVVVMITSLDYTCRSFGGSIVTHAMLSSVL